MPSKDIPTTSESRGETRLSSHSSTHQHRSHLLHLPAELRNIIYAYTFGGNTWSINMSGGQTPRADNAVKHALALLRVNQQIYAESHLFPYLCNTFEGRHNGHLREWTQSLCAMHRESITCIQHSQRGYLIKGANGVDVSPIFWMDTLNVSQWHLSGLKQIKVEVTLHKWGWGIDEAEATAAKAGALAKLRKLLEEAHPGLEVNVELKRGY